MLNKPEHDLANAYQSSSEEVVSPVEVQTTFTAGKKLPIPLSSAKKASVFVYREAHEAEQMPRVNLSKFAFSNEKKLESEQSEDSVLDEPTQPVNKFLNANFDAALFNEQLELRSSSSSAEASEEESKEGNFL